MNQRVCEGKLVESLPVVGVVFPPHLQHKVKRRQGKVTLGLGR